MFKMEYFQSILWSNIFGFSLTFDVVFEFFDKFYLWILNMSPSVKYFRNYERSKVFGTQNVKFILIIAKQTMLTKPNY